MLTGSIFDDFAIGRDPFFELSHHVYQLRSAHHGAAARHKTVTFLSLSTSSAQMWGNDIDFSILIGPQVPTRIFKAGGTIFHAGDPATELYVMQEGRVQTRSREEAGQSRVKYCAARR